MAETLLTLEVIGIISLGCIIFAPILCWLLPQHFSAS